MGNGNSISPEEFARFIVADINAKRVRPEIVDVSTDEDPNSEYVHAVAAIVTRLIGDPRPEVRTIGPGDLYTCSVDYFLNRGELPSFSTLVPKNGREDYYPNVQAAINHITTGTVIDHIIAGRGARIMRELSLDRPDYRGRASLGINYFSKKRGKKDFLKIESDRDLTQKELDLVALVSEGATICSIRSGNVVDKKLAIIGPKIEGITLCPDVSCKGDMATYNNGTFSCQYCKRSYTLADTRFK